jgi:hypothetical protein
MSLYLAKRSRLEVERKQNEVYSLMREGRSDLEILDKMGISHRTLERYRNKIRETYVNTLVISFQIRAQPLPLSVNSSREAVIWCSFVTIFATNKVKTMQL